MKSKRKDLTFSLVVSPSSETLEGQEGKKDGVVENGFRAWVKMQFFWELEREDERGLHVNECYTRIAISAEKRFPAESLIADVRKPTDGLPEYFIGTGASGT